MLLVRVDKLLLPSCLMASTTEQQATTTTNLGKKPQLPARVQAPSTHAEAGLDKNYPDYDASIKCLLLRFYSYYCTCMTLVIDCAGTVSTAVF